LMAGVRTACPPFQNGNPVDNVKRFRKSPGSDTTYLNVWPVERITTRCSYKHPCHPSLHGKLWRHGCTFADIICIHRGNSARHILLFALAITDNHYFTEVGDVVSQCDIYCCTGANPYFLGCVADEAVYQYTVLISHINGVCALRIGACSIGGALFYDIDTRQRTPFFVHDSPAHPEKDKFRVADGTSRTVKLNVRTFEFREHDLVARHLIPYLIGA